MDLTVAPLGLWAELRWIEFEFEPASDETAGGATLAAGLSLLLRF